MSFRGSTVFKLLTVFLVAFSLASLSGPMASGFQLPTISLARAIPQAPCSVSLAGGGCSDYWVPAGAAEDTFLGSIFTDVQAEFANIQSSSPTIDFTDSPLTPDLVAPFSTSPNLQITSTISEAGYNEVQFMLASNFWGCNFNFGNSTCGVQVRQGIAHMIDTASFAANDPSLIGQAVALDDPVPSDNVGGLQPVNPCAWDASFPESGSNCILGAPGGTAYRLGTAAGAGGFSWNQAPGSKDLNAAAQHFVNAGLATGFNPTTSVLTGISSAASSNPVTVFLSSTDPPRLDLGNSLLEQICYLFTGSYTVPCTYASRYGGSGPITPFPGFTTSTTSVNLSWQIYIAAHQSPTGPLPFDNSLYFQYNSKFVSGISSIQSPAGLCSSASTPTSSASNYIYLCDPTYDTLTSQMESASSISSAVTFGQQSEDRFGSHAFTIPIFERTDRFGFLNNGWSRVVNGIGAGVPNYFTWLSIHNTSPPVSGTIRQGFSSTTMSANPFIARGRLDSYIVNSVYDSLAVQNSLSGGQLIDWMVLGIQQLPMTSLPYVPPPSTTQSFRFTLRSDLFFQDGRKVTSFDVAFSYLALKGTGAFAGAGAAPMTGVTILGPSQLDINLSAVGPFTLLTLTSLPILPGAYWSNAGSSAWTNAVSTCSTMNAPCYPAQYTINNSTPTTTSCALTCMFLASEMNVNVAQISPSYDPIANHSFVGSGPWECGPVTSTGSSTTCSTSGTQNPPVGGSYTLTRFGRGLAPGSSISNIYFRSNGNLATYLWSLDTGDLTRDFLNFSVVASCFGTQVTSSGSCAHFQQGIGANGGPAPVGIAQVAIVNRFVGVNWVAPLNWFTSPATGVILLNPVLYENTITLNPASVAGCTIPYPTGGYDC